MGPAVCGGSQDLKSPGSYEYNGSQGANGAGSAGRIQPQGQEIHGSLVNNLCSDAITHKAAYSGCKTMFLSPL